MSKPHSDWTVLPHGALTRIEDNLWFVDGTLGMPAMDDLCP